MRLMTRLLAAFGIGLLLPWPGPHVDGFTPLVVVALRAPAHDADLGFWGLWLVVWFSYVSMGLGVWLLARLIAGPQEPGPPR